MHAATHPLIGWALANSASIGRRERAVVVAASIAPDLDGLGLLFEHTPLHAVVPVHWFTDYHHVATHNVGAALVVLALTAAICRGSWRAPLLAMAAFHLHPPCGSRGSGATRRWSWSPGGPTRRSWKRCAAASAHPERAVGDPDPPGRRRARARTRSLHRGAPSGPEPSACQRHTKH